MPRLLARLLLISVLVFTPSLMFGDRRVSSGSTYSPALYAAAVSRLTALKASHPSIQVYGKVTQRGEDGSLFLYGQTSQCRINVDPGCLNPYAASGVGFQEHNMMVTNPDPAALQRGHGMQYLAVHYYVGRVAGKNSFGAEVPVYVYGIPPDVVRAEAEVERLAAAAKAKGLDPATGKATVRAELGAPRPGDVRIEGTIHEIQGPWPDGRVLLAICPASGGCIDVMTTEQLTPDAHALGPRSVGDSVKYLAVRADVYKCDTPSPSSRKKESFCLRQMLREDANP
jgi:hypothetical protein